MFLMNDWSAFFLFVPFCFVFFLFFWVSVKEGRAEGRKEGRNKGRMEGWKDGRKEASKEGRRNLRPTYMFFGHRSKTKLTWTLNRSNPKPIFNRSDKAPQNKHREILNHEVYKGHAIDNPVSTMFNQQHCVSEKVSTCFGWEALLSFFCGDLPGHMHEYWAQVKYAVKTPLLLLLLLSFMLSWFRSTVQSWNIWNQACLLAMSC